MKKYLSGFVLAVTAALCVHSSVSAAPPYSVPATFTYQSSIYVDDEPFDGTGYFKVAIVDATGATLWSNDGTSVDGSEPANSVSIAVNEGIFEVPLGDTTIPGMGPIDLLTLDTDNTLYVHSWFSDGSHGFSEFTPPIKVTSSMYAVNSQFFRGYAPENFLKTTDQITSGQIATGAVGTTQISDASVTGDKITAFSNSSTIFTIGSGTATTNVIYANQAGVNDPGLRYNSGTSTWQFSNDGAAWNDVGSGGGSGTVSNGNANGLAYYQVAGTTVKGLGTGPGSVLVTSPANVPSISQLLPDPVQQNITKLGTVTTGVWNGTAVDNAHVADNLTINGGTVDNSPIGSGTASTGIFTDLTATGTVALTDATTDTFTIAAPLLMGEFTNTTGPATAANQGALFVGSDNTLYYRAEGSGTTTNLLSPPPGGPAGGDLSGNYPNPSIAGGAIMDGDINAAAAISWSKINPAITVAQVPQNLTIVGGTVDNSKIGDTTANTGEFTTLDAQTLTTTGQAALTLEPYGAGAGQTGEERFLELAAGGSNYVGFKAPDAIGSDVIWVLPSVDGTAGQCLTTDASAGLSWTTPAGTGANTALANLAAVAINTSLLPSGAGIDLGSGASKFANLYLTTNANIGGTATIATADINAGTIDGTTIGGSTAAAGTFTTVTATTDLLLQDPGVGIAGITLQAPTPLGGSYTLVLPTADGANGQALKTDGAGNLGWVTPGAVSSVFGRTAAVTAQANDYTWAQIDKTTSSIADITTRSAGDLSSGNLNIARMPTGGAWTLASDLNVDSNTFVVDQLNNRVAIGNSAPAVALDVSGDVRARAQGDVRFADADSSNFVAFQSPGVVVADVTWTLPAADGGAGTFLSTSGGGTLSWASAGGAPTDATYITQTANATLTNEQALSGLATGIMQVTTGTGVVSSVTTSAGVATLIGDETGSGAMVFGTSPTIATPTVNTSLTVPDNTWMGLGAAAGRIEFDDQATDEVNIMAALMGIGTATPSYLLDVNGTIRTGTPGTSGALRIYSEQGATDYEVVFQPSGSMTQNTTYTWPVDDGAASQLLTTDGSGALSWTSAASGNTLDGAYDQGGAGAGRTITVDSGAVRLNGSGLSTNALEVYDSGTAAGIFVENSGTGTSLRVNDVAADTTPFIIDDAGNVGIGTPTPGTNVHIYESNTDTEPALRIEQASTGDAAQRFLRGASNIAVGIDQNDNDNYKIGNTSTLTGTTYADANTMMRIHTEAGNTGIIDFNNQSRARAYRNAAQNIGTGAWTLIPFDTASYNSKTELNTATGVFTAKTTGYYQVNARTQFTLPALGTLGWYVSIAIYVNGAVYSYGTQLAVTTTAGATERDIVTNNAPNVSDVVYLTAGQTLDIRAYQNTGANRAIVTGTAQTYVSIHKLS